MLSRKMKDSGVEWIGKIPVDWKVSTIGTLFIERNEKVSDLDFPPLSVTKNGIVPQLDSAAKSSNHNNRKLVLQDDFVINSRSDRKMSSGLSLLNGSVSVINTVLYSEIVLKEYTQYLLKNYSFAEEFYRWGTGIVADLWSTRWDKMKNILIPLPPDNEQIKIGTMLNKINNNIALIINETQQSIEELKKYKQSIITDAVTKGLNSNVEMRNVKSDYIDSVPNHWLNTKLKHLCLMESGRNLTSEEIDNRGEYPVYGANGIRGFFKNFNYEGELLTVGRQGALSGNVHYINEKFWATEHALVTRAKNIIDTKFLFYLIQTMNFNRYAHNAAQPGIAASFILQLPCFLPNNKLEQQEIVSYLDEKTNRIDTLISDKEKVIQELDQYKRSLIYEYVTGKKEA